MRKDDLFPLSIRLRRDRGYVYFPDAIAASIEHLSVSAWSEMQAECYKTSDREIVLQEEDSRVSSPDLFGRLEWREGGRDRRFVLRELGETNCSLYDFDATFFPTIFHRWAVLCKNAYHHAEPMPGYRMLLQRISVCESCCDSVEAESVRLDFMTKDRFLKFSVWQGEEKRGDVVASARRFGL